MIIEITRIPNFQIDYVIPKQTLIKLLGIKMQATTEYTLTREEKTLMVKQFDPNSHYRISIQNFFDATFEIGRSFCNFWAIILNRTSHDIKYIIFASENIKKI